MYWSRDFAYVVGLITADGCLSKDGRHIDFTSKDFEQVENFKKILNLSVKIGLKHVGGHPKVDYPRIQFGNIKLYKFLLSIGLHPHKSKTIKEVLVPDKYFADFLRGYFDGDGCSYSYWDKRWRSSFMLYIGFASASTDYLKWVKTKISELYNIHGTIKGKGSSSQLMYAKNSSILLAGKMYYSDTVVCLNRKRFKLERALSIISR